LKIYNSVPSQKFNNNFGIKSSKIIHARNEISFQSTINHIPEYVFSKKNLYQI